MKILLLIYLLCALWLPVAGPLAASAAHPEGIGTADAVKEVEHLKKLDGMIRIPAGTFWMGSDDGMFPDARPVHRVKVDEFWLDETPVTNEQFAKFVRATGYTTLAEQKPDAKEFPDAPPENLVPGALVFTSPESAVSRSHYNWWRYVPGASWRHPEGPDSNLKGKAKHPVVQIAWCDAVAYAKWLGKRLPTEAEFEYAARGGQERKPFAWGDEFKPNGKWQANLWQGHFPYSNAAEDGFKTTSPVRSFPPNRFGFFDMTGNVWEWCQDWYHSQYYQMISGETIVSNPSGPSQSFDASEAGVPKRVLRGGSFLCTDQYCSRFMVGARGRGEPSSACSNIGFRCAKDSL